MYNDGIYCILDIDSIIWITAYNHRDNEDVDLVLQDTDKYITTLLDNTAATYYAGFIGGTKCFRYQISPTYKANRPPSPDWYLKWSGIIKAHLRDEWKFQVVNGIEADDAVCIYQTWCRENNKNSVMCHGDKDLYQIEGNHYDIRKHTRKYVSIEEGYRNLYKQSVKGDATDSIVGLYGAGEKFVNKLLDPLNRWEDMNTACAQAFINKHGDIKGLELYNEMYTLCKLLTHSNELPITWSEYKIEVSAEEPEIDLTGIWD